ncbi:MAG: YHS domain-containing protein [Acidobacteria bacterium]|nr:YHS domain-containing protein [Acidobacteriota bacterium]
MDALITLLLFAGFFYFMMRFGCGAHAVHGHGGHGGHAGHGASGHGSHSAAATDPVCGMTVAPGEGYTVTHEGREVRLCSRDCLDRFEADPTRFAEALGKDRGGA